MCNESTHIHCNRLLCHTHPLRNHPLHPVRNTVMQPCAPAAEQRVRGRRNPRNPECRGRTRPEAGEGERVCVGEEEQLSSQGVEGREQPGRVC